MNNRNKECWCGSKKKYKKCHLEADNVYDEAVRINKYLYQKKDTKPSTIAGSILAMSIYNNPATFIYKNTNRR